MYINNPGHMTKMDQDGCHAHIFFSGTIVPISKKLGMKHRWLKYYNVYINHDPVVTLTYFTTSSTWVAYAFE